jgi:Fe-S oxidoreductase
MKERLAKYRSFRLFMDICVRCGACADKCHFYIGSGDPKNMPVLRAELLRSVYRRYFTAAGPALRRLAGPAISRSKSSRSGSITSTSAPSAAAARSSARTASTRPRSP